MSLTRRDLLKRTGLLASALGIAAALPEVTGVIETIAETTEEPDKILGYWYCRQCGIMNTQSNQVCKVRGCQTPLDAETRKIEFSAEKTDQVINSPPFDGINDYCDIYSEKVLSFDPFIYASLGERSDSYYRQKPKGHE